MAVEIVDVRIGEHGFEIQEVVEFVNHICAHRSEILYGVLTKNGSDSVSRLHASTTMWRHVADGPLLPRSER